MANWKQMILAVALSVSMGQVWAMEMPQSAVLRYSGSYGIPATMTFKRNGNHYTVSANINVPLYRIRFESGGQIVGNQLKPSYYRDVRNGELYAAANISGSRVVYGKADRKSETEPLSGSVMDLFTLSWQLAFNDGQLPANLKITNGKRMYRVNGISQMGSKNMKIGGNSTTVNQLNVQRGDDVVQYAFAPTLNNVPAMIRYDDGEHAYNLTLKSVVIDGKAVKP